MKRVFCVIFLAIILMTVTACTNRDIDEISSNDINSIPSEGYNSDIEESNIENPTVYDIWSAESIYTAGMTVVYGGKIYKARWWTQGENPLQAGEYGAWEFTGEAAEKVPNSEKDEGIPPKVVATGNFKIVGYYPSWQPGKVSSIRYDKLTHINYAFAIPNSDGTLKPLENPDAAKKIIKEAHKHGVKVLIAIGGWSYNDTPLEPTFVAATENTQKTDKFVNEILSMVKKYGFDGVDMDWEHPRRDGNSSKQYEILMKKLSSKLHADKKLLTSAVLAGATPEGNILYDAAAHTNEVINAVDWFNVMAYDGGDGERHSSYNFAVSCGKYWKETRKMPSSKVVLGVPFYGRPSWQPYSAILEANKNAYNTDKSMINGVEAYYNGIPTIKKKTEWACKNVGGIMIWELSQDTTDNSKSLLNAIYNEAKSQGKFK